MANKGRMRTAVTMAVAVVVLVALWEGYKWVGDQTGGTWPGTTVDLPVTSNDITMPHVGDIAGELFDDIRAGRQTMPMTLYLAKKAAVTFLEATIGFTLGVVVGMGLAVLMLRWRDRKSVV